MKKKIATAAMVCLLALSLSACGGNVKAHETSKYVTLGDYKGLKMEDTEVTEADIEEYIRVNELEKNEHYDQINEGTVQDGDIVNIDYKGLKDGVAFEGGSQEGANLTIGSNSFIDGFETGLIGKKVGEKTELNLTFPENYSGSKELAGQDVVFEVKINYLCKVPELTEDYVKQYLTDYESVDAYKEYIKGVVADEKKTAAENKVWQTAVENAKISEYPQKDIDEVTQNMLDYYQSMADSYNMDLATTLSYFGTSEDTFAKDVLETVKQSLAQKWVAIAIADKEGIQITDKIYQEKAGEYAAEYGYASQEDMEKAVEPEELKEQMLVDQGRQYVLDNIAK